MPNRVVPARWRAVFQAAQGEGFRRREIAQAMLVMDRQRGARFTSDVARAIPGVEDLPPATGRLVVGTRAAEHQRERAERVDVDRRGRRGS